MKTKYPQTYESKIPYCHTRSKLNYGGLRLVECTDNKCPHIKQCGFYEDPTELLNIKNY